MDPSEARGAVFKFEAALQQEIERHVPEVTEVWVRWVGPGSEARGRDYADVHFVGSISPEVMQKCAMIAVDAAKKDPGMTDLRNTSFHQAGERSPGDLKTRPSLVWRRLVIPVSMRVM